MSVQMIGQPQRAIITASNEVGARLYFHRRLWFCSRGAGGGISACIAGGIPACLAAGPWGVVSQNALQVSRPTPRGKFRGIWPEGSPDPHPRGELKGVCSRGSACFRGGVVETPQDGYCCGRYVSYWNAFLLLVMFKVPNQNTTKSFTS